MAPSLPGALDRAHETRTTARLLGCTTEPVLDRARARGGTARVRLGVDRGGVGLRRVHARGVDRRAHLAHPAVHRDRPDLGPYPGRDRDGRAHARPSVERPLHARSRRFGTAGGRGLVRPAVRQAARPHTRIHRDRAPHPPPGGARRVPRRALPAARTTARVRGASGSRCVRSRIRCGRTCRSCSARRARRTSSSRPRSPTVGCRSTTRRSARTCTPTR